MPTIDIIRLAENPHETVHGIRADTGSRGVDLEGAEITATYADGSTETLIWQAFDPYTNGGVIGTNINMSFGWDWHHLTTTKLLTSLKIDLQPATSVFDTTVTPDGAPLGGSTPGSLGGYPFKVAPEYEDLPGELQATYSGIVNLAGSPAEGDLFTTMVLDFSNLDAGGLLGNLTWNSDIDTMRDDGDLVPSVVTCFGRGTLITTEQGDLPVETLRPGDRVLTQDNGFQELVLALNRVVGPDELLKNTKLYPVRIRAGTMGSGLPRRDLVVSRQHRMMVKSNIVRRMFGSAAVLVAAVRLTELPGIYVDAAVESVEYFHLVFRNHEIIFAEGAPTESFLMSCETRKTIHPEAWAEFVTLFPEAADAEYAAAPICRIPTRSLQKRIVYRHVKNARDLICA